MAVADLLRTVFCVCLLGITACAERVELGPGVFAARSPLQEPVEGKAFTHAGFTLVPRATIELSAKVLSKQRYRFDELAPAVPWDFALGWGAMSDESWLAGTKVMQGDRFMFWHLYDSPLNLALVERSSANMHLIPANASVLALMSSTPQGSIIQLYGRLVDLHLPDGERVIPTSLSRLDRGPGACEIVYVESLSVVRGGAGAESDSVAKSDSRVNNTNDSVADTLSDF
jgi:hypothetical protein